MGIVLGIVSMLGYGFQDFLMAGASRKIGALRTSLWLLLITTAFMALLSAFFFTALTLTLALLAVLLFAALASLIGLIAFNTGLRLGNVSVVATIANVWGAVTAILGVAFLDERITALQVIFIGMIIAGTALASLELRKVTGIKNGNLGVRFAIITLFSWGVYFFLLSFLVSDIGWFDAAFLTTLISLVFFVIYGIATKSRIMIGRANAPIMLCLAGLSLIGFLAYSLGVSYDYTAIVSPISSASPVVTVILALLLLKEKLAPNQKAGMVLVLIGLILLSI